MTDEPLDVLIVGAGLSGIGAAWHLQDRLPALSYAIWEARDAIGGTWDLFRYPGIRSDSDMHTLGYRFRPWTQAKSIADGPSILQYVRDTAHEAGIDRHIRFGHKVTSVAWDSEAALWTVTGERNGEAVTATTRFLYMNAGYYRYDAGYTPQFVGRDAFTGAIVHPQHWPDGLDVAGKRVVVIGSGATAVTLVPSLADLGAEVVMLQRSPTYIVALPGQDRVANALRRVLPSKWAYRLTRWKNVAWGLFFFNLSRTRPAGVKKRILDEAAKALPEGYDVGRHLTPTYNPWDQRMCLIPDGDLWAAISNGGARIVTDRVERFDAEGIVLTSGDRLDADVIVTATGLDVVINGGATMTVDGRPIDPSQHYNYKGCMLSDVPNFALTFGYTNASWTLKADLTAEYVCRLIAEMRRQGADWAMPVVDGEIGAEPFLDFSSGYVQRALKHLPKQGAAKPWKLNQNYAKDLVTLRHKPVADGTLRFGWAGDRLPVGGTTEPVLEAAE